MRGQENKERPQLLSEIASLETKLREDVEKLRETLPTILAGSPNLKMTLKLRTGINNLLDLFLASIRSRQRLLEEEARVERLIETGALKHNQIVSYLGGLRINFNSSNRLFAEYEFKAEDGRWGGDYAFSSREGGKVEI